MSDEALNLLLIWIAIPPMFIYVAIAFAAALGFGVKIKRSDQERQRQAFAELVTTHRGSTLDVDWMRFKTLPKQELIDAVAPQGWRYISQNYGGASWWLRFARDVRPVAVEDPRARLIAELAAAEPDGNGVYLMDATRYSVLPFAEQNSIIASAGWKIALGHGSGVLPLAKVESTVARPISEPVLIDLRLTELRENPAAIERARRFQIEHGFDPLAPAELDRLRARNNYWHGKYLRFGCVSSPLWVIAPIVLIAGVQAEVMPAVYVGAGMAAVAVISAGFAWRTRRRRKAEIGLHLAVLRELKALH